MTLPWRQNLDIGELDAFYRATTFKVYHPHGQTLSIRVGQRHSALDDVLPQTCEFWAFLTACNPRSEVLPDTENAERMQSLLQDVVAQGRSFWSGLGVSDISDWKPEESILVLGMSKDEAHLLAERYHQNAFVYGERGEAAELRWTREPKVAE
jgi:hypothetical protein